MNSALHQEIENLVHPLLRGAVMRFRDAGRRVPDLERVSLQLDEFRDDIHIVCDFTNAYHVRTRIPPDLFHDLTRETVDRREASHLIEDICRGVYNQLCVDDDIWRRVRRLQHELEHLVFNDAPLHRIHDLRDELVRSLGHANRYHGVSTVTATATEVQAGQAESGLRIEDIRRVMEQMAAYVPDPVFRPVMHYGARYAGTARYVGIDFGYEEDASTRKARKRGEQLLLDNLTPAQREQLKAKNFFEVVGSSSGKRYRINRGEQMNIYELDRDGNPFRGLCFLPAGQLVQGDVMLAQKIALETDEEAALKVANPFEVGGAVRISAFNPVRRHMVVGDYGA